jgi:DnaJ-class molecular chaperone
MRDFYDVLGVSRTTDQDSIRRAYRRLARQYHPDLNPSAADRFKEITAAYDVLGNSDRRALYDEFGDISLKPGFDPVVARHAGLGQGAMGSPPSAGGAAPGAFEEFFQNLNTPGTGSAAGTRPYQGSSREPEPKPPANGAEPPEFGGFGATAGTRPYQGSPGDRYDPSSAFGSSSGTRPYRGSARDREEQESFTGSSSGTRPYRGSAQDAGRTGFQRHSSKQEAYFPGKKYGDGRDGARQDPHRTQLRADRNSSPPPANTRQPGGQRAPSPAPPPNPYARRMGRQAPTSSPYSTSTATPVPGSDIAVNVDIGLMDALRGTAREIYIERTLRTGGREQEGLRVSIKAGVSDGEQIRLRGKGNQGQNSGPPGDLILTIQVTASRHFRREGNDLFLEVPVTLREALLGSKIEVPTPDGVIRVQIPSCSTNGRRLRLRRRGAPIGNGQRGDLYLILRPTPPAVDSPEVRRLVEALERFYPDGGVREDLKL